MRVSVVVAARDAAATIGATVSSVLWQTWVDVEAVVAVDDASTDATAAVAGAYADRRVRVLRSAGAGPAAGRNRGVEAAAGELVAFCDPGTVLLGGHVEAMVRRWREGGGVVSADGLTLRPGGVVRDGGRPRGRFPRLADQRRAVLAGDFVGPLALCARNLFHGVGPFDERLELAAWDMWVRAVLAGVPVTRQPMPLALLAPAAPADRRAEQAVLEKVALRTDLAPDERAVVEAGLRGAAGDRPAWRERAERLAPAVAGPVRRAAGRLGARR